MKKIFFIPIIVFFVTSALGQQGKNQLQIIAEAGFPPNDYQIGGAGYLKGLWGVGHSGQLTLTAGLARFNSKILSDQSKINLRLIPVLAGYKQHFSSLYLEPQAGYGEIGGRISMSGDYARPSNEAFFWAMGAGFTGKLLDLGIRYQSAHGAEGSAAGIWRNKQFHYVGVQVAFSILK